ncbi:MULTISPECIES: hypothetical protein [Cupriavidus]|uniref:hypothetical protein n=1 Tax=Cupriavidus TaxID=106589 RepID=UPI0020A35799|nr:MULTISPECIES: hypothetical protein [Cupriavidus]MDT6961521.1 hypothetical protein [Cupriavidus sp. SZY C1]
MNRQQSFSRYLSTSRTLFSHNARVARRKRIAVAALIGATVIVAAALQPAKAAADEMVIRTMGPVSYVCGGVAEDERARLAAQEKDFNMGILFTRGAEGEYLADVDVKLTRDGQKVADFRAGGPRCLIRAPEGSYNIEASYKGQPKSIKISTGTRNAQLRW